MRRVRIYRPGSYNQMVIESSGEPKPGPDEVLVGIKAAGVNYADCVVRMGLYSSAKEYVGWPITPGFEFTGVVKKWGDGVHDLEKKQEVMGVTRFGGYSTHVIVPRHQLFERPKGFDLHEAAGFPVAFLTAYHALVHLGRAGRGDTVLVHSAAGGVGGALVQLARALGCRVIGVVGNQRKVAAVRKLGADEVINRKDEPLWARARQLAPGGYQVVLDANGGPGLRESYRMLAPTGRLIIYGFHTMLPKRGGVPKYLKLAWSYLRTPRFNPLKMTEENRSVLAFNLSYLFEHADLLKKSMTAVLELANEGKIVPLKTTVLPMDSVGLAHEKLESGLTIGKIVLSTA